MFNICRNVVSFVQTYINKQFTSNYIHDLFKKIKQHVQFFFKTRTNNAIYIQKNINKNFRSSSYFNIYIIQIQICFDACCKITRQIKMCSTYDQYMYYLRKFKIYFKSCLFSSKNDDLNVKRC